MNGRHAADENARVRNTAFGRTRFHTDPRLKAVLRTRGFTLIELIVVIALMGVATDLGMIMFFKVSDAWKRVSTVANLNERADYVFDQMRKDFSETLSPSLSGVPLRGVAQTAQDLRFFRVPLEDDQITIPADLAVSGEDRFQGVEISYHIDRAQEAHTLMRTTRLTGDASGAAAEVAAGVIGLRFEYAEKGPNGVVWRTGWDKPEPPKAVRVSLTLMDPVQYLSQITRKAVFPIHVN